MDPDSSLTPDLRLAWWLVLGQAGSSAPRCLFRRFADDDIDVPSAS